MCFGVRVREYLGAHECGRDGVDQTWREESKSKRRDRGEKKRVGACPRLTQTLLQ